MTSDPAGSSSAGAPPPAFCASALSGSDSGTKSSSSASAAEETTDRRAPNAPRARPEGRARRVPLTCLDAVRLKGFSSRPCRLRVGAPGRLAVLLFLFLVAPRLACEPGLARADEVEEVGELRGDGEVEAAARGAEARRDGAGLGGARPIVAAAEPQVGQHPEAQLGAERHARRARRGLRQPAPLARHVHEASEAVD